MPIIELATAMAIRSGILKSRHFATDDSRKATRIPNKEIFPTNSRNPTASVDNKIVGEIPHGTKMFTIRVKSMICFIDCDHSIKAKLLPEYSKIIAS